MLGSMTTNEERDARIGRRAVLSALGAGVVLLGCGTDGGDPMGGEGSGDGSSGGSSSGSGSSGSSGSSSGEASGSGGSSSESSSSSSSDGADGSSSTGMPVNCEPAAEWASGGTASMTAQDCYPDPFAAGVAACALYCQTTAGPCTADTIERQDVSEGLTGLPVRLALAIVTADGCEPVAGAFVEIWHTQRTGVYSGVTPGGVMCYVDDPRAVRSLYFRGSQITDAQGRVDFDTCYPGWYPGRAIHIHFRVVADVLGELVSQLFFDDALNAEICTTHPDYAEFGVPDTTSDTDSVIGGEGDKSPYILDTARMADGAMLASKVIAIRSSAGDPLCTAQGLG
jgi:protocatechuate 3,4-dioxygenase beta subunit